jgi:organic hydroperoxide reductase OsmC/OhrA
MDPYPHVYCVNAHARPAGLVAVTAPGLTAITTAPPPEFDGPGGTWSPESLLAASVADCFVLSFRAISRASRFEWQALDCRVEAVLERVDGVTQFTRFKTHATLTLAPGSDPTKARHLLEKAEHVCLIVNSLKGARELELTLIEGAVAA